MCNILYMSYFTFLILLLILLLLLLVIFFKKNEELYDNQICMIYNYYEKDDLYKSNFTYFLENGILDDVDYYIVINGKSSVNIPKKSNIFIFNRENKGFDFGAYSYIIQKGFHHKYDYYFFMNSSVKGPYTKEKWYIPFLSLFNEDTPLVGTSINIFDNKTTSANIDLYKLYGEKPYTHIQSMFFGMKHNYLQLLISMDFFNESKINKYNMGEVIVYKEIGLSQIALRNNYNINCILPKYRNKDYRTIKSNFNTSASNGDPYYQNAYFGGTIQPTDVIFFKNNRW